MKRATLLLEDELYRRAKTISKEKGTSLKVVINHLIREGLQVSQAREHKKIGFKIPLHQGLKPDSGVDISDRNSLYEIMEGRTEK